MRPDVVNDLKAGLDVRHVLPEIAQGRGLSNFSVPILKGSIPSDHVQQATLACT